MIDSLSFFCSDVFGGVFFSLRIYCLFMSNRNESSCLSKTTTFISVTHVKDKHVVGLLNIRNGEVHVWKFALTLRTLYSSHCEEIGRNQYRNKSTPTNQNRFNSANMPHSWIFFSFFSSHDRNQFISLWAREQLWCTYCNLGVLLLWKVLYWNAKAARNTFFGNCFLHIYLYIYMAVFDWTLFLHFTCVTPNLFTVCFSHLFITYLIIYADVFNKTGSLSTCP